MTLAGDDGAFRSLVRRHHGACVRYALSMLGDPDEADDVAQETLVRAYRTLPRYRDEGNFRGWLFRILVNRCRTALRRGSRRRDRRGETTRKAARHSPDDGARILLREELRQALQRLGAEQREAFLLRHVDGLSYREMTEITSVSESALKMRVKRARDEMQAILEGSR